MSDAAPKKSRKKGNRAELLDVNDPDKINTIESKIEV